MQNVFLVESFLNFLSFIAAFVQTHSFARIANKEQTIHCHVLLALSRGQCNSCNLPFVYAKTLGWQSRIIILNIGICYNILEICLIIEPITILLFYVAWQMYMVRQHWRNAFVTICQVSPPNGFIALRKLFLVVGGFLLFNQWAMTPTITSSVEQLEKKRRHILEDVIKSYKIVLQSKLKSYTKEYVSRATSQHGRISRRISRIKLYTTNSEKYPTSVS